MKNSQELGDAKTWYAQGGWLLPQAARGVRFQPYVSMNRCTGTRPRTRNTPAPGLNVLFKGHDAKLTMEFDKVMPESGSSEKSKSIFTVQMQVGI